MAGLSHVPPPLFKRGPAPLALLTFYITLSLSLLVLDVRFRYLEPLRGSIFTVLQPVQALAHVPGRALEQSVRFLNEATVLHSENSRIRNSQVEQAARMTRYAQLEAENARLRTLLGLRDRYKTSGQMATILYASRDPFTRRIVADRGQTDQVSEGLPVIDEAGVIGQVTRVYPLASEITLLTDNEQAVPVQVLRTGLRSVAFGIGNGQMELRYLPANADIQEGDELVTSGLDGVYPAGLPVARINRVERDTAYSFARIFCLPVAGIEHFTEVMILTPPRMEPKPHNALQARPAADKKLSGPLKRRQKKN